ncbi:MAG: K(+)-transporting ATPase subunit F [Pseudomonadota bacterium]
MMLAYQIGAAVAGCLLVYLVYALLFAEEM